MIYGCALILDLPSRPAPPVEVGDVAELCARDASDRTMAIVRAIGGILAEAIQFCALNDHPRSR